MLDVFVWDNEELAEHYKDFIDVGMDEIDTVIDKAYIADMFGRNGDYYYKALLEIQFLFGVMLMLYDDMKMDIANDGEPQAKSVYYERYSLLDIKKHFECMGININNMLEVFGMGSIGQYEGLGWVAIDPDGSGDEFIIQ